MSQQIIKDFKKLLKRQFQENRSFMSNLDTNCFRVYNQQFEDINCTVDIYDQYIRITNYNDEINESEKQEIIDSCFSSLYKPKENIIWVDKKKRENKEQHQIINEEELIIDVKEFSNTFEVDLTTRVDTGLFLDQVLARKIAFENAMDKRCLNLFSYTGAFTVALSKGGAREVISVDLSKTYSNWCKRNLERNQISLDSNPVLEQDVIAYIDNSVKNKEKFDIIICDVPSFSNSRKTSTVFNVKKDYVKLLNNLRELLNDNGFIYFSTNLKDFTLESNKLFGFKITNLKKDVLAPGFTKKNPPFKAFILLKEEIKDMDTHSRYHQKRRNKKQGDNDFRSNNRSSKKERFSKDFEDRSYGSRNRDDRNSRFNDRDSRNYNQRERSNSRYNDDRRESRNYNDRNRESRNYDRRDSRSYNNRDSRGYGNQRERSNSRFNDDRNDSRSYSNKRESRDYNDRRNSRSYDDRKESRNYDRKDSRSYNDRNYNKDSRKNSQDYSFAYDKKPKRKERVKLVPYGYGGEKTKKN